MLRWITEEIADEADKAANAAQDQDTFHARCPQCGKKQVRTSLLANGCFVCGWKGTAEDLALAAAKAKSGARVTGQSESESRVMTANYKMRCPQCGASLVTEEFAKNGCWRCGYKE